jgi:hypothetical protein
MHRYFPHFLVLFVLMGVVGYAAGFASSRYGLSAAGLVATFVSRSYRFATMSVRRGWDISRTR